MNASWSKFQHVGVAAFKLSGWSLLPPALSAKNLLARRTEVVNVLWINGIDHHPVESDQESAPDSISDSEHGLEWDGGLDYRNVGHDDWEAEDESNTELDNGIQAPTSLEHLDVIGAPNVPGLIRPTQRSMKQVQQGLMTVKAMETRRNKGNKKM